MNKRQFRFAYFTAEYESTVAFYRDGLEFAAVESWDRGPDERGTLFGAASGIIEVIARPKGGVAHHLWDDRLPQGAFMVIEVADVEQAYRTAVERRLAVQQALTVQPWGHRSFCLREPNGLTLYLFSKIEEHPAGQ
jgi:catechol 2,3-dioxygenase-like lactoylglutathione lyase family enzyme